MKMKNTTPRLRTPEELEEIGWTSVVFSEGLGKYGNIIHQEMRDTFNNATNKAEIVKDILARVADRDSYKGWVNSYELGWSWHPELFIFNTGRSKVVRHDK